MEPLTIRNIINKISLLTESTGLAGRKAGDTFVDPSNQDTLVFNDLKFFPEEGGKFNPEELDTVLSDVQKQIGQEIQWENAKSPRSGGFAIASFSHGDDTIYTGQYLQQVRPMAADNYIPNIILKKYKFAGKSAQKTQAGLTPQDLLTNQQNLTIKDIMSQLAVKLGTDNPLYHVAHHIAMGQPLPLEIKAPANISFTAFRDYFCEILQPMAMQKGTYTGNAGEAAELFLGSGGFASTLINFDSSKNAGLADSRLETQDGKYVKISSKGNKGAEASAKNLIDSVDELGETDAGKKLLRKYKDIIGIVREIQTSGQSGAPLFLGMKFGIIDAKEAQLIRDLKNAPLVNLQDKKKLKSMGLTPNLIKLAEGRTTKNPDNTNLYYHLLAAVAHLAVVEVNEKTKFSNAASDILNNGALVQVYTKATERKDQWILSGFDTVYPGTSVSGVMLSASKNYASTGIKGNFTFKILRGGAKVAPDDDSSQVPEPPMDSQAPTGPYDVGIDTSKSQDSAGDGAGRQRRR